MRRRARPAPLPGMGPTRPSPEPPHTYPRKLADDSCPSAAFNRQAEARHNTRTPHGLPVGHRLTTLWGFPCCVRFPCVHAAATTPAQRLGVLLRSLHPAVSAFPERVVGSACASSFSRLARRSLALRPAHSPPPQFVARYPKAAPTSLSPSLLR